MKLNLKTLGLAAALSLPTGFILGYAQIFGCSNSIKGTRATVVSKVVSVNDGSFDREVLHYSKPVIVDFYASWCGVCTYSKPYFEELSSEYSGSMKFVEYDCESGIVDESYNVDGYPTYIIFRNGSEVGRQSGFSDKEGLENFIEDALK